MKKQLGAILDASLLNDLRVQAARESRPMEDLISDAVSMYLMRPESTTRHRIAFRKLLDRPAIRASSQDVRFVLREDDYG